MKLLTLITALCVCLSFLLAPSTSLHAQEQSSLEKADNHDAKQTFTSMPRKLKHNEDQVKGSAEATDFAPYKMEASSGKLHQKEGNQMHAGNSSDESEYFTMDYGWVRRRRPIHNKHVPIGP